MIWTAQTWTAQWWTMQLHHEVFEKWHSARSLGIMPGTRDGHEPGKQWFVVVCGSSLFMNYKLSGNMNCFAIHAIWDFWQKVSLLFHFGQACFPEAPRNEPWNGCFCFRIHFMPISAWHTSTGITLCYINLNRIQPWNYEPWVSGNENLIQKCAFKNNNNNRHANAWKEIYMSANYNK